MIDKVDMDFWTSIVEVVPRSVMERWIRERFEGAEQLFFYTDCAQLGGFSWIYDTLCCHESLDEPSDWFMIKCIRYWLKHKNTGGKMDGESAE